MKRDPRLWLILLPLVACAAHADGAADVSDSSKLGPEQADRIDRLFSKWDSRFAPGGVVAVIRDGRVVHRRAFGMANLDFDVPNSPDTRFHLASVSKQFTALAVLLLRQDGKLSLDDDVRKFVPELPDFGKTITVRHLLHHTSGLRDQPHLMWMAGWRFEDEVTTDDVLRIVARQRSLNFAPGDDVMYCNTGYTLLGVVVERVSGKSLAQFSRERIFQPLGMNQTLIQDDHHQPVKGRAVSYRPAKGGGYEALPLSDSTVGQTGVVSTIEDVARWDQNFYDAKVGGAALMAQMLERGQRNNGEATRYAAGLGVDEYRGLPIVEHSGSIAAYRCRYLRFPEQRFSVIVLANAEDLPATDTAHRIADICLEDRLRPKPEGPTEVSPAPQAIVEIPPAMLEAYTGDYQLAPGDFVTISREGSNLMVQGTGSGRVQMTAASRASFLLPNKGATVTFVMPEGTTRAESIRLGLGAKERIAQRIDPPPLAGLVGDYYSPELGVLYRVKLLDNGETLRLLHPRGEIEMRRTTPDTFELPFPLKAARFDRDQSGRAKQFLLDGERSQRVRFGRIELPS